MKRHQGLVGLSHDHHHALVAARRLRLASATPEALTATRVFVDFFLSASVPHFRQEEELLFPLVAGRTEASEGVTRALLEHQALHAAVLRLDRLAAEGPEPQLDVAMGEVATLLEAHVRFEERELFPLIQELLPDVTLSEPAAGRAASNGPVWGAESDDLNATILHWTAGHGTPEHVNDERDVLVAVTEGSAAVYVDDAEHDLLAGEAMIISKGSRRRITAGDGGVRYVSAHRRRPPLQIASARPL